MTQKPIFRPIESIEKSYFKHWLFYTYASFFIVSFIFLFTVLICINCSIQIVTPTNTILQLMVLLIIPSNFLICEIDKYFLKRSKKRYNKVIIDHMGIKFINTFNQTTIAKILWKNIQYRLNEKYDIGVLIMGVRHPRLYFLWNLNKSCDSIIPLWSPEEFARMFAKFKNASYLTTTLFSGIATFRPEIRVNPDVYTFYNINPITLEKL